MGSGPNVEIGGEQPAAHIECSFGCAGFALRRFGENARCSVFSASTEKQGGSSLGVIYRVHRLWAKFRGSFLCFVRSTYDLLMTTEWYVLTKPQIGVE